MGKTAGYKTTVEVSNDDGSTWLTAGGINSVSVSSERDELEVTDFESANAARERLMGLKSWSVSLSGHFVANAAQDAIRAHIDEGDDNDELLIRVLWDGSAGVSIPTCGSSYDVSSELEGTVEFSSEHQSRGVISAVTP